MNVPTARLAPFSFFAMCLFVSSVVAQVTPSSGNVGASAGGPFDVLTINGSNGGADRKVDVAINSPISIAVGLAPTVPLGAGFAIYGYLGAPGLGDVTPLPGGIGTAAFPFCPLQPLNPFLFALTDNLGIGICPQLLGSFPAPWSTTFGPGLPFPFTVTLQGVIADTSGVFGIAVTNAVTLEVIDDGIEVLYSKIAGHPTALVPGAVDTAGTPAVTEFRAFEQLVGSPDGSHWMIRGRTQQGTASETMMMIGMGATGSVFAQKGRPVHGGVPGEVYDFFGSGLGRFNDANDFAYSARAAGGVANTLQKVIKVIGGVPTIPIQQGSLCIGLMDLAPNPSGDELFGNSVGSVHLRNDNSVGTQDSTITVIHSSRRPAIFYDQTAFHQTGVTTVTGLGGMTTETWATIDANSFYTTPSNSRWVASGRIVAPSTSDGVLVVDGVVRIQEGNAIPGSAVIASTILSTDLSGNGHWYTRGAQMTSGHYAVADGTVVATTGGTLTPSSAETWSTTFSAFVGNRNGEWAIFGKSQGAPTATDDVIVFNGTHIVAREGDPVDLDGNGLFDDNVFIGRGNDTLTAFSADNAFLTDDRTLYFFISLKDGAGNDLTTIPAFSTPLALLRVRIVAN